MKYLLPLVIIALCPVAAHADSITFAPVTTASGNINLNADTAAFAYYSDNAAADYNYAGSTAPTTSAGNLGGFTAFTIVGGGYPTEAHGGGFSVTYFGGVGGNNPATASGYTGFLYANPVSGNGNGFSVTSTLFAPIETFNFYLIDYNTKSDLSASLNDAGSTSSSLTNVAFSGDGSGGTSALVSLTVSGSIGDVLTFADVTNSPANAGNTGIIAADIASVPEPSTWLVIVASVAGLFVYAKSRKNASA